MENAVERVNLENITTTTGDGEKTSDIQFSGFFRHGDRIKETVGEVNGFAILILIQVIVKVKGVGPVPYSWRLSVCLISSSLIVRIEYRKI